MAWAVDQTTLWALSPASGWSATGSSGTIAATTNVAVASGARIFLAVSWFQATETLASVAGGSLTWTIPAQTQNGNQGVALVYADAPAGLASGTTITATFSTTAGFRAIVGASMTGGTTGAAQGAATATGNSNAHTINVTTTTDNAIVVEATILNAAAGSAHTPTAPAIELVDATTAGGEQITLDYRTTTTATAYTIAGGWANSTIWSVGAAGFAEAAAAVLPPLVMGPPRR
jgi:Tfp pilus assembly protein PilZ